MNTAEISKAPWRPADVGNQVVILDDKGNRIAKFYKCIAGNPNAFVPVKDNVILAAAAPALLKACLIALARMTGEDEDREAVEIAVRRAIRGCTEKGLARHVLNQGRK